MTLWPSVFKLDVRVGVAIRESSSFQAALYSLYMGKPSRWLISSSFVSYMAFPSTSWYNCTHLVNMPSIEFPRGSQVLLHAIDVLLQTVKQPAVQVAWPLSRCSLITLSLLEFALPWLSCHLMFSSQGASSVHLFPSKYSWISELWCGCTSSHSCHS